MAFRIQMQYTGSLEPGSDGEGVAKRSHWVDRVASEQYPVSGLVLEIPIISPMWPCLPSCAGHLDLCPSCSNQLALRHDHVGVFPIFFFGLVESWQTI
jgi:hypothetical protein